ncbi:MAG: type II toxin-antitoxin system Phd/YefM family antitoxin [Clostridia bacterium]|nr:type II toxin-antitoxin system Phd/YefM family antitoxin [Clostridia bacterium]MDD4048910.1 type II toxin-antitoxin system Phd/YefM family antitoxin [Clostridia bacterium]
MTNTNITNFRKNVFEYINQAIEFNDIINVNTKNGNAVIMSEEEYNGFIETLYLSSNPAMVKQLKESLSEPFETMISVDDVEW